MKTILVVDDCKPFLDESSGTVKSSEILVFTGAPSRQDIEQIQEGAFDLVINDLLERQTAKDGLAVVRVAKQNGFTPFIAATVYRSPEFKR